MEEKVIEFALSEYNEGTSEQLDYYFNERKREVGDKAYLYSHGENEWTEMEILKVICRSDNFNEYDALPEDILLLIEDELDADTSAEFITDNDCYLIWFKYC